MKQIVSEPFPLKNKLLQEKKWKIISKIMLKQHVLQYFLLEILCFGSMSTN